MLFCFFCCTTSRAQGVSSDAAPLYQQFKVARLALTSEGPEAMPPFFSRDILEYAITSAIRSGSAGDVGFNRERFALVETLASLREIKEVYAATVEEGLGGSSTLKLKVLRHPCADPAIVTIEYRYEYDLPRIALVGFDTTREATAWLKPGLTPIDTFSPYEVADQEAARKETFRILDRPYKPYKCPKR